MILAKSITIIRKAEEQVSDQCKRAASSKHPSWFVEYNGFSLSGGGKERGHRKDRWGTAELPSSHFPALSRSFSLNSWCCLSQGLIRLCPKDTDEIPEIINSTPALHTLILQFSIWFCVFSCDSESSVKQSGIFTLCYSQRPHSVLWKQKRGRIWQALKCHGTGQLPHTCGQDQMLEILTKLTWVKAM